MGNITDLFALTKTTLTNLPMLVRFMIALTLFLLVPGISERFKIPGMVGLILVGLLGGPSGIDIWPDNPVILTAFSEMGVLLVLFYAGLEIDLAVFKRVGGRAIAFGLATLLLPLSAGAGLGYLMGYDLNAAILIGSLIASHTLLGFPILLHSPIRRYDGSLAGGLAFRVFNVLHEYASGPQAPRAGLATRLSDFATNRHE